MLQGRRLDINHKILKMNNVTADLSGLYNCVASNEEGDGQSNAVNLNVQCKYTQKFCKPKYIFKYYI